MQPTTSAEKELLKESLYKTRVQNLLRKQKDFLLPGNDSDDSSIVERQYAAERSIVRRIVSNETSAVLCGVALSGLVFASVRYGPRRMLIWINPDKERLLKEADDMARKANTRWMQKITAFVFEASFGAWAGWRGYNIMSSKNTSSYEEIAKLPLVAGRSKVAERVCPEWINLVQKEIHPEFWKNLDHGEESRLRDPQRWRLVRDFARNCVKRNAFEESYRKQNELSSGTAVNVPEGGVPEDIPSYFNKERRE